jgi:retron-type reverse transcriptase
MGIMFKGICSWDNLLLAFNRAAKGKRGQANVSAFEHRLEDNLLQLQTELREGRYQPGAYTSFYIHEPKIRLISAAPFRDRVVHHALCNIIEPMFEKSFIADSYANRIGKGTHRAIDRVQRYSRRFRYVLQCDIRQFFPSIDHRVLKEILERKISDPMVFRLIDLILASGASILNQTYSMVYFPVDDLFAVNRPRGLPIGNLTSQFWANCYLNPFDHFVKRELRCPGYVRYVDDCVLFADRKEILWDWLARIHEQLDRLRLTIHGGAQPKPVTEGIPFLGFIVYPDRRRLKRRKGVYFQRKLKEKIRDFQAGHITLPQLTASVQGWVNHVRYGNTVGLRRAILRECIVKR